MTTPEQTHVHDELTEQNMEQGIKIVMDQTGCTRQVAVSTLMKTKGDLVEAIMIIYDPPN